MKFISLILFSFQAFAQRDIIVSSDITVKADVMAQATWHREGGSDFNCSGTTKRDASPGIISYGNRLTEPVLFFDSYVSPRSQAIIDDRIAFVRNFENHVNGFSQFDGLINYLMQQSVQRNLGLVRRGSIEHAELLLQEFPKDTKLEYSVNSKTFAVAAILPKLASYIKTYREMEAKQYTLPVAQPKLSLGGAIENLGFIEARKSSLSGKITKSEHQFKVSMNLQDYLNKQQSHLEARDSCGKASGIARLHNDGMIGVIRIEYFPEARTPAVLIDVKGNAQLFVENYFATKNGLHGEVQLNAGPNVVWIKPGEPIQFMLKIDRSYGPQVSQTLNSTIDLTFEDLGQKEFKVIKSLPISEIETSIRANNKNQTLGLLLGTFLARDRIDNFVKARPLKRIYDFTTVMSEYEMGDLRNEPLDRDLKIASRLLLYEVGKALLNDLAPYCQKTSVDLAFLGETIRVKKINLIYYLLRRIVARVQYYSFDHILGLQDAIKVYADQGNTYASAMKDSKIRETLKKIVRIMNEAINLNLIPFESAQSEMEGVLTKIHKGSRFDLGAQTLLKDLRETAAIDSELIRAVRAELIKFNYQNNNKIEINSFDYLIQKLKKQKQTTVRNLNSYLKTVSNSLETADFVKNVQSLENHVVSLMESQLSETLEPVRVLYVTNQEVHALNRKAAQCWEKESK